ncbi:unnamed protein product [Paramecium sonneborni]|uniref:Uncharacterized protein n=1 Tax=Paramecium sonneborni TaxID=65129 RepID=A0A8S1RRT4_9CILI|nr:unnamed protein product [Paramecium sonneborni]
MKYKNHQILILEAIKEQGLSYQKYRYQDNILQILEFH